MDSHKRSTQLELLEVVESGRRRRWSDDEKLQIVIESLQAPRAISSTATSQQIEARCKAFIRKWRVKHRAVADSLDEAGARLFSFTRLPPEQWKSARTTNAIERLHKEFKRRIKTQTVLPSAETAAMLLWALLASGQINIRKVDGWKMLTENPSLSQLTSPPDKLCSNSRSLRYANSNHIPDGTHGHKRRRHTMSGSQKAWNVLWSDGLAEEKTLHFIAGVISQERLLFCRFDAFGDDRHPERLAHADNRLRNRLVFGILG